MALPNEPITRQEMYLSNIAGQNTALPDAPITREEMYLDYIAKTGGTGEGDMKKSIYDSDTAVATAGGIKMFVNQKIGTLPQRVGSLETTAGVLQGEVVSIENTLGTLGTASTKNSTSVVTQSTDLVESGAVKDIVGWGNKNLLNPDNLGHNQYNSTTGAYDGTNLSFSSTTELVEVEPGATYCISKDGVMAEARKFYYKDDGTFISSDYSASAFTIPSNATKFKFHTGGYSGSLTGWQMEKGSTATAYEPYHASVDESKCDNSVIGTVEDETNPTKAYAVGEHMIRGGKFCTVTVPVTTSSTWTLGSNYVEGDVANSLIKEITFGGTTSSIGTLVVSTSSTMHLLSAEVEGCIVDLYKRSEGYGAVIKTPQGEVVAETAVRGKCYYISY